ncbi:MAG: hypothetical protein PHH28_01050 [Desulfuromonadaceae bacterium]|nr:hypothetical protein [Desulfuromonadaceae bacterium]
MKYFLIAMLTLAVPAISQAEFWGNSDETRGVGYLAKADGTKIYQRSEGDAVAATVKKDFPMVAFESKNEWLGIVAAESVENGRAHVRYFNNGQNAKEGKSTAWVDLKDVERINFSCCDDNAHCTGIKDPLFRAATYTDCFIRSMEARIEKPTPPANNQVTDIELEKLKLQLEIEKLKLEQERLKAGVK